MNAPADTDAPAPRGRSRDAWLRLIKQARQGNPSTLLHVLLQPETRDGQMRPLPGSFTPLPDDEELRLMIIEVLMFPTVKGGWGEATSVSDLLMHTGKKKHRRVSDDEVTAVAAFVHAEPGPRDPDLVEQSADALGLTPETLIKRFQLLGLKPQTKPKVPKPEK